MLSNKTLMIGGGLAVLVLAVALIYKMWPATLPDMALPNADGEAVRLEAMHEGKEYLVGVFLLNGCPISKFSLGVVQEQYDKWSTKAAFVGLYFGTKEEAAQFQQDQELPFDVYGLRSATDPFAVNQLIEAAGSSEGMRAVVYGGTVVVIDRDRSVVLRLEKEDVKKLPEELADLLQ